MQRTLKLSNFVYKRGDSATTKFPSKKQNAQKTTSVGCRRLKMRAEEMVVFEAME